MRIFKRILCVILAVSMAASFASCDKPDAVSGAKGFIDAVNSIGEVTLESSELIDGAYVLYKGLSEEDQTSIEVVKAYELLESCKKELKLLKTAKDKADKFIKLVNEIPQVVALTSLSKIKAAETAYAGLNEQARKVAGVEAAHTKLTGARAAYDALKAAEDLATAKQDAANFVALAQAIPSTDKLVKRNLPLITAAETAFAELSDLAKAQDGVSQASQKVVSARERYDFLVQNPTESDKVEVAIFKEYMQSFPDILAITLDSLQVITEAETAYRYLSDSAKLSDEIVALNQLIVAARAKYDEIYASSEGGILANAFIAAVAKIPALDAITAESGLLITNAEQFYLGLTADAMQIDGVAEAKATLDAARAKYDTIERSKLPSVVMNGMSFSGDVMPYVLLNNIDYTSIAAFYGVTVANLTSKVDFMLNIYETTQTDKAQYFAQSNISKLFTESEALKYIVLNGYVVPALEKASATVPSIKSGDKFRFSVQYVDKTGLYASSDITDISDESPRGYTFKVSEIVPDDKVYKVSTTQQFLDIKNHLNFNVILEADIDLSGINWHSLGAFTGKLDGKGHKVYNMECNEAARTAEERAADPRGATIFALFDTMSANAVVKNLAMHGVIQNAGSWAGAIVIDNNGGLISNCYINLDITALGAPLAEGGFDAGGYVGGICCNNNGGTIAYCIVDGVNRGTGSAYPDVKNGAFAVGNQGTISNCYANKDTIATTVGVGNSGALADLIKPSVELKNPALYSGWDKTIWNIQNGFVPTLKIIK